MKKNYSLWKALLLSCVFTTQSHAQLSGVVTINSAQATGGTNYQNFSALATALNANGVSGPLTVNVLAASGPYTDQPNFGPISGTSATNTITINGNNNLLTYSATTSTQPWILSLSGADYMMFNHLNIQGTGTYAFGCILSNSSNNNVFTSCTFSVPATGTSYNQIPVVLSGSGTTYNSYGNSGNDNAWIGCTMSGGGYGISLAGSSSSPYTSGNKVINCLVTNYYARGIYVYYYSKNYLIKGNTVQRPNRTNSTTVYGILCYQPEGAVVEGNRVQNLFDSHIATNTSYGIYMNSNNAGGGKINPNTIRNNIVSDIRNNGTSYGIAAYYIDGFVYHNTISYDHAGSTAGTTYGIYSYGQPGMQVDVKNNNISVTRGGTGTKYCFYTGGTTGNLNLEKNNYYMNAPAGTNYVGYYSSPATNLGAFQAQGVDPNGISTDPMHTSLALQNYIPTSTLLNNVGAPVGVIDDIALLPRSGANPDIGAHEYMSIACVGTPSANAMAPVSTTVCSGEGIALGLANYYSDLGVSYQWAMSYTSAVGPYTVIPGATSGAYQASNITTPTWFTAIMTCANGNGSIMPTAAYVDVAGTVTNSVPYFESFEGIGSTGRLPNCSWSSSSPGMDCMTYTTSMPQNAFGHTGTNYATFNTYYILGSNYYYTNGIYLNAGITYSASLFYKTDVYGDVNVTDLSILLGQSQSPTGLVPVASTNGPAVSVVYKLLSNTFNVATSGIYYVAVRATSDGNYGTPHLVWDDLSITIPCSLNAPQVTINESATTICQGDTVHMTASGADSYLWSTGATGNNISVTPSLSGPYSVVATNSLSGCSSTIQTQNIVVKSAPPIYTFIDKPFICKGDNAMLSVGGANTYSWSNNQSTSFITVSPNATTVYTVTGYHLNNCASTATQQVVVYQTPTVNITSNASNLSQSCAGDELTLTASGGATSYTWSTSSAFLPGSSVVIHPSSSITYTLLGTDANGCVGKSTIDLNVMECTGLSKIAGNLSGVKIYPNPTSGAFTVELASSLAKTVELSDLTGRIILSATTTQEKIELNVANLANGIYYVKIQSENAVEVVKIVKH